MKMSMEVTASLQVGGVWWETNARRLHDRHQRYKPGYRNGCMVWLLACYWWQSLCLSSLINCSKGAVWPKFLPKRARSRPQQPKHLNRCRQ
jgi:hypothetical protein